MGQIVELEGSASAINPGDSVNVTTADTPIADAQSRKALVLANPHASSVVWITLDETGAASGQGIPIFPSTGLVLKEYHGAVCAATDTGTVAVGRAEW